MADQVSSPLISLPGQAPAEMLVWQAQIGDLTFGPGTSYIITGWEGFGTPDVRTTDEARTQEDGDWLGTDTYSSRVMTISLTIRGASASAVNERYKEFLREWRMDDGETYKSFWFWFPGEEPMRAIGRPRRVTANKSMMLQGRIDVIAEFYSPFSPFFGESIDSVVTPRVLDLSSRTNLIPNPSFETDTASWGVNAFCTLSRSTAWSSVGTASLAVTSTSATNGPNVTTTATMLATPGLTYRTTMVVRAATVSRGIAVFLQFFDSGGGYLGASSGGYASDSTSVNTTISDSAVAPEGTFRVGINVIYDPMANGEVHYIDTVLVEQSSVSSTYFDGSFPGFRWDGTAHASTSSQLSGGRVYPLVYPRYYAVNSTGGQVVQINNDGSYPSWGVLTFTGGPATNPKLVNEGTGQYIGFAVTLTASDVLVVDMRLRTAFLNGTNVRHTILPGSSWWAFPVGITGLQYLPTAPYTSASICTITTATASIG